MVEIPVAKKVPTTRNVHGYEFVDNYEWLRDKESAETRAYLEAENAYTEEQTAHLETLRENLFQEMKSRIKETDMSVPTASRGWWYYGRTVEGENYGVSCRVKATGGSDEMPPEIDPENPPAGEEVLLDLNALAEGHEFFSIGASSVSTSGNLLAYSIDTSGDERFDLRIKDLRTGQLLDDAIDGIAYGATWCGDEYLFYQRVDEAWRPHEVWRHKVGTPVEQDVLVFKEEDERYWVGVGSSRSEKFLYISCGSKITSEAWVLPMADPEGEFVCMRRREQGVEYDLDHAVVDGEDRWIVTHNAGGANFEIGECAAVLEENSVDLHNLRQLVPHRDDVRIEGVDCFAGHIVLGYRAGGIGRVAVMKLDPGYTTFEELSFDEELYTVSGGSNPEWDTKVLRMVYGSFLTPSTVLQMDIATGERTVLKQQEVPGGYDPKDYTAFRLWAQAEDGTRIPVSIVHRADLDVTKPNPTMLYAYGSYETSIDPGFSVLRLSLLDRGMIFAVAHVRGGGEMGRLWYDNGKVLKKKATFTDFIDVADHLIKRGVTTPEQLVADGGSAGGLLMGAVANMSKGRFKGIVANVPFVDPLTSMLMPELPLTVIEWDEWGDPLHNKEVYEYMASYSPYENVTAQDYPNILALTSLNDTRVLYVEPAKWVAKLRDVATAGQFLLKTEMVAGHGGVSGRYNSWKEAAFEYAWIINQATGLEA